MQTIIELPKYNNYIDNLNNLSIIDIPQQQNSIIKDIILVLVFTEDLDEYPDAENIGYELIKLVKLSIGNVVLAYETGEQFRILDKLNPHVIPKVAGNKIYIPLFTSSVNLLPILSHFVSSKVSKLLISFKQTKHKLILSNSNIIIRYFPNNMHLVSNFYLIHIVNKYYLEHKQTSKCTVTFDNLNHFFSFFHISISLEHYFDIKKVTCTFYDRLNESKGKLTLKPINKLSKQNKTGMMTFECLETMGNNNWIYFKNSMELEFEFKGLNRPEFCYVLLTCKKHLA